MVGPGLSTFYFAASATGMKTAVAAFFTGLVVSLPPDVNITVPAAGDQINTTDGSLTGTWAESGGASVITGQRAQQYTLGVGCRVVWLTSGIYRGRRVRGSTFIAPITNERFEGANKITSQIIGDLSAAANALLTAQPTLTIYSRAVHHIPARVDDTDGAASTVIGVTVPDAVSWLRSRRT